MASFKVIIIGCGLAGGLLGNGLLHNGIDFAIYEADERGSTREGYQIRLGSPAIRGFKACLTEDQQMTLYAMFGRSGGLIPSAPILYDTDLAQLLDLTKFPAYTKSAPIDRVVLRNFLQQSLDQRGAVKFQKKFKSYEVREQPGQQRAAIVRVLFEDGSWDECDLLISAEGSRSRINKGIGLDNIVQLHRRWGFLAKGSLSASRLLALTPEVRKASMTIIKNNIILFCSAYLPRGRKNRNTDDSAARMGEDEDFDEDMASLFWGLQVPAELCPVNPRIIDDKVGFCLEKIKDWDSRVHDVLRAADNDDVFVFQSRVGIRPAKDWRAKAQRTGDPGKGHDQVWLLGDAVHPMLPARGMGGNQAMSDTADLLPEVVALARESKCRELQRADFSAAVRSYEKQMLPRAFKWVKASGGTQQILRDPTTWAGRIMRFFATRVLDLAYLVSLIMRAFGFGAKDDAPELPD